jgi:hypothetical protein
MATKRSSGHALASWASSFYGPSAFARYLAPLAKKKWVVYAKAPLGGPQQVLEYLGRYTHRVAISNQRLRTLENGMVSFDRKDYRNQKQKIMTVPAEEFIRLFLQHSLPTGLQRIRYYGFLANCHRAEELRLCRTLLAKPCADLLPNPSGYPALCVRVRLCPRCGIGTMVQTESSIPSSWPRADAGGHFMRQVLYRQISLGRASHSRASRLRPTTTWREFALRSRKCPPRAHRAES